VVHWPSYNQSLVRRGEILFSYDFLDSWDPELERMNKNKEGKPYLYPDFFILAIGYIRTYLHLPYRQTEGIIKATGKSLPNHPCYEQICKRINKLNINDSNKEIVESKDIVIAIDSTGIKTANRGQWLRDKWSAKKKGYLKIHVAVNTKTKEILALEVTDEKVHDGKVMCKLVDHILKQNNAAVNIKTVLADGAYDNNENFKCLQMKRILPAIKARKNSIISPKNNKMRNREVKSQTKDLLKWKKKRGYGERWMAETAFSSIKRMLGEYVSATRFQNMVKEMMVKVSMYNLFRRMA
jgi:hypothetical protein